MSRSSLDIQASIECVFTLILVRDMIITYSYKVYDTVDNCNEKFMDLR